MQFLNLLMIFAMAVLVFQLSSKIIIESEVSGSVGSPLYLVSVVGLVSSLGTGAEVLSQLVENVNREGAQYIWPEKPTS